MASHSASILSTLLEAIGIPYQKLPTGSAMASIAVGRRNYHRSVFVEFVPSDHWVTIRGYLQASIPASSIDAVARYLSELNAYTRLARYCIIGTSAIVQTEVRAPGLTRDTLVDALYAVARNAMSAGLEVMTLSTSQSVSKLYATFGSVGPDSSGFVQSPEIEKLMKSLDLKSTPIDRIVRTKGGPRSE